MDLFKHPYYRLNKTVMTCIGQWPDQSMHTRRGCRTVLIYFFATEAMSRIRTISNENNAWNVIMDLMAPIFIVIIGLVIFLNFMSTSQTTLKLLNRIRTDWQLWAREREVNILHEYAELGKNINIALAATVYSGFLLLGTEPVVEKIIDILMKNGTEPGKFLFLVDYYHVNEQKYYFYVTIYFAIMCIEVTAPAVVQTIMLVTYTLHGSGLFAALRYVNLIEAAYTWNFFISTGFGMILVNATGLRVLTNPNNLHVAITCGGLVGVVALFFLVECLASQVLIDHSNSIRVYIYDSQWYTLSPKAQKLLQCMTMRCNVPCHLTAGNMLIMSIRSAWQTLKLLNRIRTDWQVWAREKEVNILHEYTAFGRKLNIAFAVMVYSGGFFVGTEPTIEKIVDILLRNGTNPGKFLLPVDYYHVDEQKYYFYVTIYFTVISIAMTAPAITQIIMLISYTQHGSGIFAALRYVNLIEASYTWNFFISTAIGMILINASGLQVLRNPNNLQVTITYGALILVMGFFFLIECLASQILIDHSISIRIYIYNSHWYRLSPKTQKLLQCMTMRCNVPSQLTAGNMLIMSVRTVWLMSKTTLSYFTFVRSTQEL